MKTVQVRKNAFLFLSALGFLSVLVSGCLKEAVNTPPAPKTRISLLHLAPLAPAVEVYFDNSKASSAIAYPAVSPRYSAIDPGAFAITFKKASTDSVVSGLGAAFYDSSKYYTLVLYNTDPTHVGVMRIQDDYSQLSSDRALYRFFHLGVDVGSVDVHFGSAVPEQGRQFADNNMSSLYSQYNAITPNTYEVVVKKAGTDSVIASKSSVFLEGRAAYTFFLRGAAGATGTNAVTLDYMQAAE